MTWPVIHAIPAHVFDNENHELNLYGENVEVDYCDEVGMHKSHFLLYFAHLSYGAWGAMNS
jgi:hypothetical protein